MPFELLSETMQEVCVMSDKRKLAVNADCPVVGSRISANRRWRSTGRPITVTSARTTTIIAPGHARFRLMAPAQQQVQFENTARFIGDAPREIQLRHIGNCMKAEPACGKGVARALGIPENAVR
jgi:catalase